AEALLKSGGSASRALALVNAVRLRAGATPLIALTSQNIYDERRLELMGEGTRWFDLVRTGQAATALASRGFTVGKNELFPISYRDMQNPNFKQNYGYPQ
ncbi:RagB/SusD family nutrient uptake outer membrane protein, partial [Arachidicoccus sp.]|uniref:RagB/SusD family nutrient uptake outer membrane protein n=1 Tax=Arachidicoccus sp. TaxID=1872624 RepID=UPI003D1C77B2